MTKDDIPALVSALHGADLVGEFLAQLAAGASLTFPRTERCLGNVYVRPMDFPKAGDRVEGHKHRYDHLTYLTRGSLHVRTWEDEDGKRVRVKEGTFKAPGKIMVAAGRQHEFTALEDGTLADCVFAHRDYDGSVVEAFMGFAEATH